MCQMSPKMLWKHMLSGFIQENNHSMYLLCVLKPKGLQVQKEWLSPSLREQIHFWNIVCAGLINPMHLPDTLVCFTANPCVDTHCSQRQPEDLSQRLDRLMQTTNNLNVTLYRLLFGLFGVQKTGKRLVIVTGASSDHYYESQGLIQSVHQNVFPELANLTLIYYDLGLKDWQRDEVLWLWLGFEWSGNVIAISFDWSDSVID